MSFWDKLEKRSWDTLLCVGLDPRAETVVDARDECIRIITATARSAACFKPNIAFFEQYGADGLSALHEVLSAIPDDIPVILDAKRGDIAATAEAYAKAIFEKLGAHAVTLSPYMGLDSIEPFSKDANHGVFVLCRTSNPGGTEFQELCLANGSKVYENVARLVGHSWNTHGNLGLVVGASDLLAAKRIRDIAPKSWFLLPGVGAQGGDLEAGLHATLREDHSGVLVNVSRGISGAADPGQAAQKYCEQIQLARQNHGTIPQLRHLSSQIENLAIGLFRANCLLFGNFTLKSGIQSPIYVDLRRLISAPDVLHMVAGLYANLLRDVQYDRLVGLPYAGLPIATAVSQYVGKPMIYPRRETKDYGTHSAIEGIYHKGESCILIDDLITDGATKVEALDKMKEAELKVKGIAVLIDRQQGGRKFLDSHNVELFAVASLLDILEALRGTPHLSEDQYKTCKAFLTRD